MTSNPLLTMEAIETRDSDSLLQATVHLEEAARLLDVEDWIVERLRRPEREVTVNLPLSRGRGPAASCTGLRVQHNSTRGPCMGEVRLSPEVQLHQVRARAAEATWQAALLDLPLGGSAGALVCNPQEMPERELRQLIKDYVYALREFIGPFSDVLTTDGSNEYTAAWMLDSYARTLGRTEAGVVTGKAEVLGGITWRQQAPGLGIVRLLEEALAGRREMLARKRVAIQGLGNVGASALKALHQAGAQIVAVADVSGGVLAQDGIDVAALQQHLRRERVVFGFPEAEAVSNSDVLQSACDVLVAAVPRHQINSPIAQRVQAAIVVEAAEEAVTPEAEKILLARDVLVAPAMLGTAGVAIASFAEWTQAVRGAWMDEHEAVQMLRSRLAWAYQAAATTADKLKCSLRAASYVVAIERVAAALRLRAY